jgi:hypothetical protein
LLCRDAEHAGGFADRNDARGIAQMMRAGLYRPVHVKTVRSQKLRMLLTCIAQAWAKTISTSTLEQWMA